MKKILAVLLVLVMMVTCFSGCKPKKSGSELGNTLNQISQLGEADGFKTEMNITLGVSFEDAVLSEASLGALLGEAAPAMMSLLSLVIKDDRTAELVYTAQGVATKDGGAQVLVTIGKGEKALACTGIVADEDVFVDVKTIYTWLSNIMAPAMGGESLPVWPYQNAYVSMQDLVALFSGMMNDSNDMTGNVAYTTQAIGGLGAITTMNPEMLEAVLNGLMEAIPKESLAELVTMLETALTEAGMLTTKDGFVTVTMNGDNMKNLPDALIAAVDGKLASVIDSIVNGIRNSDNEIIASMIPADEEIDGQEIEDDLIAELEAGAAEWQEDCQEMKDMNFAAEMGIKADKKSAEYRLAVGFRVVDEEGFAGNITMTASAKMEAAKDVSVRVPGNVMTEAEISDFFSAFAQIMG